MYSMASGTRSSPVIQTGNREVVYVMSSNPVHLEELKKALLSFYVMKVFSDPRAAIAVASERPPNSHCP